MITNFVENNLTYKFSFAKETTNGFYVKICLLNIP